LTDTISDLYNKHFPLKHLKNPWVTPGILRSIRRKNKLYRIKLKNPTNTNIAKFRNYRNKLNHLIRYTKKEYYRSLLKNAQGNMRATWKVISELLNKKRSNAPQFGPIITYNNKPYSKQSDIADVFNSFFTNVGPSLAKKFPNDHSNKHRNWMKIACHNNFDLPKISEHNVLDELYNLDSSKAIGHNDIPVKYIKKVAEYIYQPLSFLFNTSIQSGIFPEGMKTAKVIPIHKGGDKEIVSNYRPISLLPTFSKLFEKLTCTALTDHLENNNLLYDYQFGFRKRRNTTLAAVDFVTRLTDSIDSGNLSIGVFLDLSKAFDTVSHEILLDKLSYYGLTPNALRWFESYLTKREQYVCIEDFNSNPKPVTCGIPQGSALGPVLFLIFVNDAQFVMKDIHL